MRTVLALVVLCGSLSASLASAQECLPACRDGFMCHQGTCISACNPECPSGERCTGAGVCTPVAVSPAQPMLVPPPPPPSDSAPRDENGASAVRELPGWALGGAILGFVTAPIIFAISGASAATAGELWPSLPLGALATVMFGVLLPIVANAGASARNGTGVSGSPGLRVTGWVLYGVTLALAVTAVVLGVTNTIPVPIILGLGGAGFLAMLFMSIDALVSRSQAQEAVARSAARFDAVRVAPFVTVAPQPQGAAAPMIGLAGVF